MTDDAGTPGRRTEDTGPMADSELLRRYAVDRDDDAFTEIVHRHLGFVYAAAIRQAHGNRTMAEDVTQTVFTDLARKAGTISRHAVLVGWLHTATRFAATRAIRTESRRRVREQQAFAMNERLQEPAPTIDWQRVQPVIDEVLGELKERERVAILLRFFEGKPFAEVGAKLALTEPAARSCVDRALEKMRGLLAARGVSSTSAALGIALTNQLSIAAPAGLGAAVATTALAGASAASGAVALGTIFAMSKIKAGIAAAVIIAGATVAVREAHAIRVIEKEIGALRSNQEELGRLRSENTTLASVVAKAAETDPDAAELARLSKRIAQLKLRPDGVLDAEMKPLTAFTNAGRNTALAAMETQLWARANGDDAAFAQLLGFTDRSRANLDAFFAALPEAVRTNYGTPEKMLAPMAATWGPVGPPVAVQLLGQTEYGLKIMVHAWARYGSGDEGKMDLLLQRYEDGWRVPHSDEMMDKIIASLDPVTGQRRPKAK
jgi:RNA polymerase sigma factor (sigma-70 family)